MELHWIIGCWIFYFQLCRQEGISNKIDLFITFRKIGKIMWFFAKISLFYYVFLSLPHDSSLFWHGIIEKIFYYKTGLRETVNYGKIHQINIRASGIVNGNTYMI